MKFDWLWIIGGIAVAAVVIFFVVKPMSEKEPVDMTEYMAYSPFPKESAFKLSPHPDVNPYPYDYLYSEVPY